MFKETKNIDSAFRHIKTFTFIIVAGCFLLCGFVMYKSYELSARVQDKIYILAGDQAMEAFASKRKDNLSVEAKSHISLFHIYFFTLDPDDKVIEKNISKALYMADASAKKQYNNLKETGYYSNIIAGNISQQISIDSIIVDIKVEPYFFDCYSTERIIRPNSIVTRNLITQGFLRNVSRSDHNPHGFLIERWETLENKDIKTENR
jgi:conjugative transposon TraK protein